MGLGLTTSSAFGGNLLTNPGFDVPTPGLTPPNYPASVSVVGSAVPASADAWGLYQNNPGTTTSELLTSTDPSGGGYMIHVTTPGSADGLFQFFANPTGVTTGTVDLFVLSGIVNLEFWNNNGNNFLGGVSSTTTNHWQTLTLKVTSRRQVFCSSWAPSPQRPSAFTGLGLGAVGTRDEQVPSGTKRGSGRKRGRSSSFGLVSHLETDRIADSPRRRDWDAARFEVPVRRFATFRSLLGPVIELVNSLAARATGTLSFRLSQLVASRQRDRRQIPRSSPNARG
jgi:hypothetical protein